MRKSIWVLSPFFHRPDVTERPDMCRYNGPSGPQTIQAGASSGFPSGGEAEVETVAQTRVEAHFQQDLSGSGVPQKLHSTPAAPPAPEPQ